MILIIGGFCAGKRDFGTTLGYNHDELFLLEDDAIPVEILCTKPVILLREMGCGLVPIDPDLREKREKFGRLSCILAKEATAVYRVTCGIGMQIK